MPHFIKIISIYCFMKKYHSLVPIDEWKFSESFNKLFPSKLFPLVQQASTCTCFNSLGSDFPKWFWTPLSHTVELSKHHQIAFVLMILYKLLFNLLVLMFKSNRKSQLWTNLVWSIVWKFHLLMWISWQRSILMTLSIWWWLRSRWRNSPILVATRVGFEVLDTNWGVQFEKK